MLFNMSENLIIRDRVCNSHFISDFIFKYKMSEGIESSDIFAIALNSR